MTDACGSVPVLVRYQREGAGDWHQTIRMFSRVPLVGEWLHLATRDGAEAARHGDYIPPCRVTVVTHKLDATRQVAAEVQAVEDGDGYRRATDSTRSIRRGAE
jgi:hypothetical protein